MSSTDNLPLAPNTLEEQIELLRAFAAGKEIIGRPLNGDPAVRSHFLKENHIWNFVSCRYDIEPEAPVVLFVVIRNDGCNTAVLGTERDCKATVERWHRDHPNFDGSPFRVAKYAFAGYVDD